ncbi:putative late blight resistance protein -like protein R1B-16-like [Capsicum annuum]|nr:putative late blight resistance protein -like protein R1B-16-like [Capsicum annuum]
MDGTGIINLLLWNREAMQLIGKSAKELKEGLIPDDECSYPSELDDIIEKKFMLDDIIEKKFMWGDIIEKKFMFKIMVKESNINKHDEVYKVVKFVDDEVLFKEYSHPSLTYNVSSTH